MIHSILLFVYLVIKRINLSIVVIVRKMQKGKVLTSVCHSVHRGRVLASVHAGIHTPLPGQTPGGCLPQCMQGYTPHGQIPWADIPQQSLQRKVRILPEWILVITICNEVAKVMFLQACACPQRGVCLSACWDTSPPRADPREQTSPEQTPPQADPPRANTLQSRHPPEQTHTPRSRHTLPPRDGHCCGRYASYWNAFLL